MIDNAGYMYLTEENYGLKEITGSDRHFGKLMGTSAAMQAVYNQIESIAGQAAPVFITGETGTGKERSAQAIHKYSDFKDYPFISMHCSACLSSDNDDSKFFSGLPDSPFTLFLDEITDLPLENQSRLLGLMYSRQDIRYISASCHDLQQKVEEGDFRKDLFYRICGFLIHMPPLRECSHDVLDIAHACLCEFSRSANKEFNSFSTEAEKILKSYKWPGNVRELENTIRQAVLNNEGTVMDAKMLPGRLLKTTSRRKTSFRNIKKKAVVPLWQAEKRTIEEAIDYCNGNITHAAKLLEISASTIYRKLASWPDTTAQRSHGS